MSAILQWYTSYFGPENAAEGIYDWSLLGSPIPVLVICGAYLFLTLKAGPKFMNTRQAFDLKGVLLIYNTVQIVSNMWIFYYSLALQLRHQTYSMTHLKTLPENHPQKSLELWTSYTFFLLKVFDLFDTAFFVLRKSHRQISFLHVYHHVNVLLWAYFTIHFYGFGGFYYFFKVFNSFVHSVMYGYYLLSSQLPQHHSKIVKVKKYITRLQLIQFASGIVCVLYYIAQKGGNVLSFDLFAWYSLAQIAIFVYLFMRFYIKSYVKRKDV